MASTALVNVTSATTSSTNHTKGLPSVQSVKPKLHVIARSAVAGADRVEPPSTPQALDSRCRARSNPNPAAPRNAAASRLAHSSPFAGGAIVGALAYVVLAALFTVIGLLLTQVVFGDGPPAGTSRSTVVRRPAHLDLEHPHRDRIARRRHVHRDRGCGRRGRDPRHAAASGAEIGVPRHRPRSSKSRSSSRPRSSSTATVRRSSSLDDAPPTSSFPSGHTRCGHRAVRRHRADRRRACAQRDRARHCMVRGGLVPLFVAAGLAPVPRACTSRATSAAASCSVSSRSSSLLVVRVAVALAERRTSANARSGRCR